MPVELERRQRVKITAMSRARTAEPMVRMLRLRARMQLTRQCRL